MDDDINSIANNNNILDDMQKKIENILSEKQSSFDYKINLEVPKSLTDKDFTKSFLELNKNLNKKHQNNINRVNFLADNSILNSLNSNINNHNKILNENDNINIYKEKSKIYNLSGKKFSKEKIDCISENLVKALKKNSINDNNDNKYSNRTTSKSSIDSNSQDEYSGEDQDSSSDEKDSNYNNCNEDFDKSIEKKSFQNNNNKKLNNHKEKYEKKKKNIKNNSTYFLSKKIEEEKAKQRKELRNIQIDFNAKNEFDHYPTQMRGKKFSNKNFDKSGMIIIEEDKNLNPMLLIANLNNITTNINIISDSENNLLKRLNSLKNKDRNTENNKTNEEKTLSNSIILNSKNNNEKLNKINNNNSNSNINHTTGFLNNIILEDSYKDLIFDVNEITEKVLDFNFFRSNLFFESDNNYYDKNHFDKQKNLRNIKEKYLDELKIPNSFISNNHYRYLMRRNFFEEFKSSLLNSKGEDNKKKNFKNLNIKVNFILRNNYLGSVFKCFSINLLNKTLDKKKTFKENDIFAFISQKELINQIYTNNISSKNSNDEDIHKNYTSDNKEDENKISNNNNYNMNHDNFDFDISKKTNFNLNSKDFYDFDDIKKKEKLDKAFENIFNDLNFINKKKLNYFLGIVKYEKNSINNKNDITDHLIYSLCDSLKNIIFYESENFYIKFLGNINSSIREYNAILEIDYTVFNKLIYDPEKYQKNMLYSNLNRNNVYNYSDNNDIMNNLQSQSKKKIDEEIMKKFICDNRFRSSVDTSQMKALESCSSSSDCVLIQGPPGTGKTHTILCIISMYYNIPNAKILVCAPSNSAIDEISIRLHTQGILDKNFNFFKPYFIRFGIMEKSGNELKSQLNQDQIEILKNHTMEKLVENKFKESDIELNNKMDKLQRYLRKLEINKKGSSIYVLEDIDKKISDVKNKIRLIKLMRNQTSDNKKNFELDLLEKTRIICTTLNSSGNNIFKMNNINFDYLIIDEACQCVEPSALIPMQITRNKIIMVGDHIQLPATTFFKEASQTHYNRSLFERLIDNGFPKEILNIQYRMEKNIREFIGKTFYNNLLTDSILNKKNIEDSIFFKFFNIKLNYCFFHLDNSTEKFCPYTKSYYNELESEAIILLLKNIYQRMLNFQTELERENVNFFEIENIFNFKFAIITPYKAQVKYIIEQVEKKIPKLKKIIEINTVDSFQGREQDIVIISCVRSNANFFQDENSEIIDNIKESVFNKRNVLNRKENIGFLNDYRRMNVALSRAKFSCFIIGDYFTLKNNEYWSKLIDYCNELENLFVLNKELIREINSKISDENIYNYSKSDNEFDYLGLLSKLKDIQSKRNNFENVEFGVNSLNYHKDKIKDTKIILNNRKNIQDEDDYFKDINYIYSDDNLSIKKEKKEIDEIEEGEINKDVKLFKKDIYINKSYKGIDTNDLNDVTNNFDNIKINKIKSDIQQIYPDEDNLNKYSDNISFFKPYNKIMKEDINLTSVEIKFYSIIESIEKIFKRKFNEIKKIDRKSLNIENKIGSILYEDSYKKESCSVFDSNYSSDNFKPKIDPNIQDYDLNDISFRNKEKNNVELLSNKNSRINFNYNNCQKIFDFNSNIKKLSITVDRKERNIQQILKKEKNYDKKMKMSNPYDSINNFNLPLKEEIANKKKSTNIISSNTEIKIKKDYNNNNNQKNINYSNLNNISNKDQIYVSLLQKKSQRNDDNSNVDKEINKNRNKSPKFFFK